MNNNSITFNKLKINLQVAIIAVTWEYFRGRESFGMWSFWARIYWRKICLWVEWRVKWLLLSIQNQIPKNFYFPKIFPHSKIHKSTGLTTLKLLKSKLSKFNKDSDVVCIQIYFPKRNLLIFFSFLSRFYFVLFYFICKSNK